MTPEAARQDWRDRLDTLEEAYEFFLAYAAQGRRDEPANQPVRSFLAKAEAALDGLVYTARKLITSELLGPSDAQHAFVDVLEQDATKALAAIRLVQAQQPIGSQLVDNLNASIHLRALLTDLFLIDETLDSRGDD